MTMKQMFAKAQREYDPDEALYDEYYEEMQKKYACERARVFKQREFKREDSEWCKIERRLKYA